MKHLLLISLFALLKISTSLAQGGWDIDYVETDSIDSSHIGLVVKLDFRHESKKPSFTNGIRGKVTPCDTGYVLIDNTKTRLIERRLIYVDQGFFNDQFLEILQPDQNISECIEETEIIEITKSSLKVKATSALTPSGNTHFLG